jgi:hypothetical protein
MRDTGKVVLTFFGSIVFCGAVVGTIQSLLEGGQGNGPSIGGIVIGVGLGMLLIPRLRDEPNADRTTDQTANPVRRIDAA